MFIIIFKKSINKKSNQSLFGPHTLGEIGPSTFFCSLTILMLWNLVLPSFFSIKFVNNELGVTGTH